MSEKAKSFRLPKAGSIEVAPSILSADFANLAAEIAEIEAAGVKIVHLDVMDGHFVPNITFGPPIVAKLRACSNLVFDTHLMIEEPQKYAEAFVKAGSDHISFHIETVDNPLEFIDYLHGLGVSCGVTLNPETPVEDIEEIAAHCDMVLIMTVHPGFGGQKFIDSAARKCIRIKELVGPETRIQVDGGINSETSQIVIGYGADTLVAGNAVFSTTDRAAAIEAILAGSK